VEPRAATARDPGGAAPAAAAWSGEDPRGEYWALAAGFLRAWETGEGRAEAWFIFIDHPVRLRIAGAALAADLFRAFSHLRIDPPGTDAALTVDLWDERETGVPLAGLGPTGDPNDQGETHVSGDGRHVVVARPRTRTAADRKDRHLVGWIARNDHLTQYELGRPLHSELLLWHKDRGALAIHAGMVARDGNAILLGGPGGAGKSTSSLVSLLAGFEYMADDYVALTSGPESGYMGHSLYCSTHLEPHHLERFPELEPHAIPGRLPREDKSLVLLSDVLPGGLSRKATVRAVALPRLVDADDTTVRPASKVESLLRMAPSSLLLLPYAGLVESEFERLGRFLEDTPTYWLDLGRDLDRIPLRIGELLERHT
jgi:hypothetical protein